MSCTNKRSGPSRRGFTLLEILLVVLVVAIVAATLIPATIESVQGTRLRTALRQTISLVRYARSKAILEQRPMALLYHADSQQVEVVALPPEKRLAENAFVDTPPPRMEEHGMGSGAVPEPLQRFRMPRGVRIDEVEGAKREEDSWFVVLSSDGMTSPHTIHLTDSGGAVSRIRVNGITGEVSLVDR